jgi:hypothetical protein
MGEGLISPTSGNRREAFVNSPETNDEKKYSSNDVAYVNSKSAAKERPGNKQGGDDDS